MNSVVLHTSNKTFWILQFSFQSTTPLGAGSQSSGNGPPSVGGGQPHSNFSQQDDTQSNPGSDTPLTSMVSGIHSNDNNSETGKIGS